MCLTKNMAFLNNCRLYIIKICALRHAILDVKIGAMLCFENGFGIAVPVFIYWKHLTRSSIV